LSDRPGGLRAARGASFPSPFTRINHVVVADHVRDVTAFVVIREHDVSPSAIGTRFEPTALDIGYRRVTRYPIPAAELPCAVDLTFPRPSPGRTWFDVVVVGPL